MGDAAQLGVRQPQELFEPDELGDEFEGRGVDGVAAEVAEEVVVLLEYEHVHAGAREQQAEHGAGRSAAHDAAGDGSRRMRLGMLRALHRRALRLFISS